MKLLFIRLKRGLTGVSVVEDVVTCVGVAWVGAEA